MTNKFEEMTDEQFAEYVSSGSWMVRGDPVNNYIKRELLRRLAASQPGEPLRAQCPKCGSDLLVADMGKFIVFCNNCKQFPIVSLKDQKLKRFAQFFLPSAPSLRFNKTG